MSEVDLSQGALQLRREIAEKATQGTWITGEFKYEPCWVCLQENSFCLAQCRNSVNGENNAAHVAINSPDAVLAMIAEIERLRAENAVLEKEAYWLCNHMNVDGIFTTGCPAIIDESECDNNCPKCWREATRRAVESANGK